MAKKGAAPGMRPSLQRLKSLDSLPNLQSQLQEAKQLCTQSARADMISKWLLEKLKKKSDFRASTEAWETLLSTFRLLSPPRLAGHVSSHGFLGICKTAVQNSSDPSRGDVFLVIKRALTFLFEVSAGPEGTQLKATLSLPASEAATFLQSWAESILSLLGIALFESNFATDMLQPGIEIWNLRKKSSTESDEFARHSFLPIARLLPVVKHYETVQQRKRKSRETEVPRLEYKRVLESMLARHVFVPARTFFFKQREGDESRARKQLAQDPKSLLRSMLTRLRNDGLDEGQLTVLPALFDVIIRSTPILTPSQRYKEKAWLDAAFEALHECMGGPDDSNFVMQAIEDILCTVKQKHTSLSKPVLDQLIERHAGLDDGKNIAWRLISLVLAIDSDVFADDTTSTVLMNQISKATIDKDKKKSPHRQRWRSSIEPEVPGKEFINFLQQHIAAPLIDAFAQRRELERFVDMWAFQIAGSNSDSISPVWTCLGTKFGELLEEAFTHSQILKLWDRYSAALDETIDADTIAASRSTTSASIIVMDATLGGIKSGALSAAFYERCGTLLMSKRKILHTLPYVPQKWTLMTKTFSLWFPRYAAEEVDTKSVAKVGMNVLKSAASGVSRLQSSRNPDDHAARKFLACICHSLRRYDEVECLEAAKLIVQNHGDESRWPILVEFPDLIADLGTGEILTLADECVNSGSTTAVEFLKTLSTQAFTRHSQRADAFLEMLLRYVKPEHPPLDKIGHRSGDIRRITDQELEHEITTLSALSGLPPNSIPRTIRENMVDAICHQQQEASKISGLAMVAQSRRLSVLSHLMELPNSTAKLATDPEEILRLMRSIIIELNRLPIESLRQLTIQLCGHLLTTQDQQRSRSMLEGLSGIVKEYIEETCVRLKYDDGYQAAPVFIDTLIEQLETGAKGELRAKLEHRNPETMKQFIGTRLECIALRIQKKERHHIQYDLKHSLDTLLSTPSTLIDLPGINVDEDVVPLIQSTITYLQNLMLNSSSGSKADQHNVSDCQEALVTCFQIIAKASTARHGGGIAAELAQRHLTPTQRDLVMAAFEKLQGRMTGLKLQESMDGLLYTLESDIDETSAASTLSLLEISARKLSNADLEKANSPLPKLLSTLMKTARNTESLVVRQRALVCVMVALRSSDSFLINQYCIEMILTGAKNLLEDPVKAQWVYLDICRIMSVILLQYRSRLHGRFHLVVPLFQALLSRLVQPTHSRKSVKTQLKPLSTKHANAAGRLLSLFAEPPQSKRSAQSQTLVDEARKEQAYVGKSTRYILHHYCSLLLSGRLEPGMKEALTPGLWSIIEGMEMGEAEGIKSLSSAMNNSERAVLRGVFDEWRRFGKWRGG